MAAAVWISLVVTLPVALLGGLAVLIQDDLLFGDADLGVGVAVYFASAAISVPIAGRLVHALGWLRTTSFGLVFCGCSLGGIAVGAISWQLLLIFLVLGGVGEGLAMIGVNVMLAQTIPAKRWGFAYGIKQASVPLGALLAGLSLPLIGLSLGWRWPFLLSVLIIPVAVIALLRWDSTGRGSGRSRYGDASIGALVALTLGIGFATAGATSTAAFIVPSAVDRGFSNADAGLLLAGGGFLAGCVRVFAGLAADRLPCGSLPLIVGLVIVGASGYLGLAIALEPSLVIASAVLAFGGGWGFAGLVHLAVARSNRTAPALAMGIVQVGPLTGAVLGPLVFGGLAERGSHPIAWFTMAAFALFGAALILYARHVIRSGMRRREPQIPLVSAAYVDDGPNGA